MTESAHTRRYSLRILLAAVTGCAVVLAACSGVARFVEREWNEPARVGQAADAREEKGISPIRNNYWTYPLLPYLADSLRHT